MAYTEKAPVVYDVAAADVGSLFTSPVPYGVWARASVAYFTDYAHPWKFHSVGRDSGIQKVWEDSLLDLIQDAGIAAKHIFGEEDIRKFAELAEKVQAKSMPSVHPDPTKTRWYNMAYQEAIAAGGTLDEADNAGWSAWRWAMDQKSTIAYNKAFKDTSNRSTAMRAFWQNCPRIIPRPVDHIAAIQGNMMGLVLAGENKRHIDWHIAALKLKNGELKVGEKLRAMLKDKLVKVSSANEFLALL